jgi:hypothetical protein
MNNKLNSLPNRFRVVPADPNLDLPAMAQLTARVFNCEQDVDQFKENYIGNSHYDWGTSRLIWDGDTLVHHWGVWGYKMRLESVELKVAGIGAVATLESCRKMGLMHYAAENSFNAMETADYDLSILRGRHYVEMGYARAWNYLNYFLKPEDIPILKTADPYQVLAPSRVTEMDALYNQEYALYSGTAIRPTFRNKHPVDMGVHAWFSPSGQLIGYVRALPSEYDPETLTCLEACGDPLQALAVVMELYKIGKFKKLTFFTLPYLHPLLQFLRRGEIIIEDHSFAISGWRVRIINLRRTLEKLTPLFEERLGGSKYFDWSGSLYIDGGEQKCTLVIERGLVKVSDPRPDENGILGGADIARLLIGSDEPEEIIRQGSMECQGQAIPLARVLFPNKYPMLSHWDEF